MYACMCVCARVRVCSATRAMSASDPIGPAGPWATRSCGEFFSGGLRQSILTVLDVVLPHWHGFYGHVQLWTCTNMKFSCLWPWACWIPIGFTILYLNSLAYGAGRMYATLYSIQGWSALQVLPLSWARGASTRRAANHKFHTTKSIPSILYGC